MPNLSPPVPGQSSQPSDAFEMAVLKPGDSGNAVRIVQNRLAAMGFYHALIDGVYGTITQNAIMAFQNSQGLNATGSVDHLTLHALGFEVDQSLPTVPTATRGFSVGTVSKLFPSQSGNNIKAYLPTVLSALEEQGLADPPMVLMALATIRAETGSFKPISEYPSKYNTKPGGRPYALYDFRTDLGNNAPGDGDRYKGRGFIQLTGKSNYQKYSQRLGLGDRLIDNPDIANDPIVASRILAAFLKDKEPKIRESLARKDYATARKAVNGGTHGLNEFQLTYQAGAQLLELA